MALWHSGGGAAVTLPLGQPEPGAHRHQEPLLTALRGHLAGVLRQADWGGQRRGRPSGGGALNFGVGNQILFGSRLSTVIKHQFDSKLFL